jgi:hypothetical protein
MNMKTYNEGEIVMKNLMKTCCMAVAVLGVTLLLLPDKASAAYSLWGYAKNYRGERVPDITIECMIMQSIDSAPQFIYSTTDSNGKYNCYFSSATGIPAKRQVSLTFAAGESHSVPETAWPTYQYINIEKVPDIHSPSGQWYARRFGDKMTPYPIVHLEGYDPQEKIKSDEDIPGANDTINYKSMMIATELPNGGENMLQYLKNNGYTFWLLMNGLRSGDSYKGSSSIHYTDGLAYQAMALTKKIADLHKGQFGNSYRGVIVGGFSGGGLLARTGLLYWCHGYWADASYYGPTGHSNINLPPGCYDVAGWYSGDGPLEGALMPGIAQKIAYDPKVEIDILTEMKQDIFETPYAAEVLKYTIPWYDHPEGVRCDTCGGAGNLHSKNERNTCRVSYKACNYRYHGFNSCGVNERCNHGDIYHVECPSVLVAISNENCVLKQSNYNSFMDWALGTLLYYPSRPKIPYRESEIDMPVPGIAWSHGTYEPGQSNGGVRRKADGTDWDEFETWAHAHIVSGVGVADSYFHTNIGLNYGDSTGPNDHEEHLNGSFFSQWTELEDLVDVDWKERCDSTFFYAGCRYKFDIYEDRLPTYITTTSSLATNTIELANWWDYNYQDQNCAHIPSPPVSPTSDSRRDQAQPVPISVVNPDADGGFGQKDVRMLLAFVHEQLKGQQSDSPICNANTVRQVSGKSSASCRSGSADTTCNCEDDDGDECVDGTMNNGVCEPIQNCSADKACPNRPEEPCASSCHNRECGTDGCDGFCGSADGTCGMGQECDRGQCNPKQMSCAEDPSKVDYCTQNCMGLTFRYSYSGLGDIGECIENCIYDLCPGGGDDDGDIIHGLF